MTPPVPILISSGEPAGIGPDLLIALSQHPLPWQAMHPLVAIADPALLLARADILNIPLQIIEYIPGASLLPAKPGELLVWPLPLATIVQPGKPDPDNVESVLAMINIGCDECLAGNALALVTAPLSKAVINQAGVIFSGHTEYLAARCGAQQVVMLLTCPQLRVALVTTHVPLRQVSESITPQHLRRVLSVVEQGITGYFGIQKPALLICGLNPHAGESGCLGSEEQEVIAPVIEQLQQEDMNIQGPVAADTAFSEHNRKKYDVFVCMYHDQGLPVLKTLGFAEAVNITLGLPIVRTSVDHGTAFTLAGTGNANPASLYAAIDMAYQTGKRKWQVSQVDGCQ